MTDDLPRDDDGNIILPACPVHGIHAAIFRIGDIDYCGYCLIDRLDGIAVHRMGHIKLTDEEFKEMQEAGKEAAE